MPTVKRFHIDLPAVLAALLVAGLALGDGNVMTNIPNATPVAVVSIQASTNCIHTAAAAGAQAIATVPSCGAGFYFYVTYAESCYSAIAAPAATLMATTSTNIPTSFGWSQPMQAVVGDSCRSASFPLGLKTTSPATATVLTGNAAVTSISENMKLCGFCAL